MIGKWWFYAIGSAVLTFGSYDAGVSGITYETQLAGIGGLMCLGIGALLDKMDDLK